MRLALQARNRQLAKGAPLFIHIYNVILSFNTIQSLRRGCPLPCDSLLCAHWYPLACDSQLSHHSSAGHDLALGVGDQFPGGGA